MHRIGPRDAAFRSYHTIARATLNEADDSKKMQETSIDMFRNDRRTKVERVQNYGDISVPLPRDEAKTSQKTGPDGLEAEKGPAAEAVVVFPGGSRNHPVVLAVDDRRHRPKDFKPGETGKYDDQGQAMVLGRDRAVLVSNKGRASLRHSSKKHREAINDAKPNADVYVTEKEAIVEVGGKILCHVIGGEVFLGAKKGEATFSLVMTEAGPAANVYAKVE